MVYQESETVELKSIVAGDIKNDYLMGDFRMPERKTGKCLLSFGID